MSCWFDADLSIEVAVHQDQHLAGPQDASKDLAGNPMQYI